MHRLSSIGIASVQMAQYLQLLASGISHANVASLVSLLPAKSFPAVDELTTVSSVGAIEAGAATLDALCGTLVGLVTLEPGIALAPVHVSLHSHPPHQPNPSHSPHTAWTTREDSLKSPALLGIGSNLGCHARRSSSALLKIWRAFSEFSNAGCVSPGTMGESSRRTRRRRACFARMICFSARSMVAARCRS